MQGSFVALDLETTGLDPDRDAIIEVAALRFDASGELAVFDSLVRPEVELSARSRQLTGLSRADLESAPSFDALREELRDFLAGATPVGHSVGHDLRFLARRGLMLETTGLDTFELSTLLLPEIERYSLANISRQLALDTADPSHRALADARAHHQLFLALLDRARRLPVALLARICRLAEGRDWPAARLFQMALDDPLPPRLEPAEEARIRVDLDAPVEPRPAGSERFDLADLEARIAPGGALEAMIEGFEDRPGQREMLRRVAETFRLRDHLLIEAGTGTGKSLAYLLPALAAARAEGEPVVLATHTIALQQQLMDKDIPQAASLLGIEPRVALLKGRANYLCRSRLDRFAERTDLEDEELRAVVKLLIWDQSTRTGDRSELLLQQEERATWAEISAEAGCHGEVCHYAAAGRCWLQRARARAAGADLIVTNHALLASDLRQGAALLPPYRMLVVDEAHHLEAVATDALGLRFDPRALLRRFEDLAEPGGALSRAARALSAGDDFGLDTESLAHQIAETRALAGAAAPDLAALFGSIEEAYVERAGKGAREMRLTDAVRGQAVWLRVETDWDLVGERLRQLEGALSRLAGALEGMAGALDAGQGRQLARAAAALRRRGAQLAELRGHLESILARPHPSLVTWLERAGPGRLSLHSAPLDPGPELADRLFADRAVVLTSATLRAGDDFDFIRDRLCLPDAPAVVVEPAFDYDQAVLLCAPDDLPPPDRPGYEEGLARLITELAGTLGGRCLVLYTSYRGLKQTYHRIRGPLGQAGIAVIAQGIDGSRHQLLSAFRDPEAPTVLLGTRSFWEGIDVPGPALSALVIARLPFDVPTDPVYQARAEAYDDPFGDYSLPLSILRFRQGFGRLIRSARDRGVAVVADSRVHHKSYGPLFLDSLPACRRFDGRAAELPMAAARFLRGEQS